MPGMKGTSGIYENYLNNLGNYLGQSQVNTGRPATTDQIYGATQGALTPLLAYDIQRRRIQMQNQLAWQQQHDQRQQQPSSFEKWTKGILGGAYLASSALTGGAGLSSLFSKGATPAATPSLPSSNPLATYGQNQGMSVYPELYQDDFWSKFGGQ